MLRRKGVVGKFVEFYGDGLADAPPGRPGDDRQHGPRIRRHLRDLPGRRRDAPLPRSSRAGRADLIALVEAYCQGARDVPHAGSPEAEYSDTLELDLATVEPSLAGPKRPQDRVPLHDAKAVVAEGAQGRCSTAGRRRRRSPSDNDVKSEQRLEGEGGGGTAVGAEDPTPAAAQHRSARATIDHGSVVIAAITSCTNTSNPSVMIAAGLLAKKAVERGLTTKPWVKASLAPGLEGGDRLSQGRRARQPARRAPVQPRRLRLHDLHRQLRAALAARSPRRSTTRTSSSPPC